MSAGCMIVQATCLFACLGDGDILACDGFAVGLLFRRPWTLLTATVRSGRVVTAETTSARAHLLCSPYPAPPLSVPDAEGIDSRLTATLQAVLTASRFLDRGDTDVINKAVSVALDCAAAAAAAAAAAEEPSEGEEAEGARRGWPGPNLAAMSLLSLLHVAQNRWEGIPAAIHVLQQMVSG